MNENERNYLTQKQAAPRIGVHPSTLSRLCARGEGPPFYKIGNQKLFKVEDLEEWLEEQRNETDKK